MFGGRESLSALFQQQTSDALREIRDYDPTHIITAKYEDLIAYFLKKYSFTVIELDPTREAEIERTTKRSRQRNEWGEIVDRDIAWIVIDIPVVPNADIARLLQYHPSTMTTAPPEITYLSDGFIQTMIPGDSHEPHLAVERQVKAVQQEVEWRNEDINRESAQLGIALMQALQSRRHSLESQQATVELIAQRASIPLKVRNPLDKIVPQPLTVKSTISVLIPPHGERPTRPVLDDKTFTSIIELIDNSCRQFERTPSTFALLGEEALRDVILSNLNGVFEGDAVGEAFSNQGKTDIFLKISKGNTFIAECKYWSGPDTVRKTTQQILSYLTWRESYGVVVMFSRNKGFTSVLEAAFTALSTVPGYAGAATRLHPNHFSCACHLQDDKDRLVQMHYVIYNLCPAA